jgi:hypothetical protein
MSAELLLDDPDIVTTARLDVHAGRGTVASIEIAIISRDRHHGSLTLGEERIEWRSPDGATIAFTPSEFAATLTNVR